jgi:hypothetical protein
MTESQRVTDLVTGDDELLMSTGDELLVEPRACFEDVPVAGSYRTFARPAHAVAQRALHTRMPLLTPGHFFRVAFESSPACTCRLTAGDVDHVAAADETTPSQSEVTLSTTVMFRSPLPPQW